MASGPMPPNVGSAGTANTFASLSPITKVQYPSPTQRKKRFAKIREKIEGKR
jgi:hypothetical protein